MSSLSDLYIEEMEACKEEKEEMLEKQRLYERYEQNQYKSRTISLTVSYDKDVLDWYKSKGKGYQSKIKAALRAVMEIEKEQNHDWNSLFSEEPEILRFSRSHTTEKDSCTARYDPDVLRWYKMYGKGYQQIMNDALRAVMEAEKECADMNKLF